MDIRVHPKQVRLRTSVFLRVIRVKIIINHSSKNHKKSACGHPYNPVFVIVIVLVIVQSIISHQITGAINQMCALN